MGKIPALTAILMVFALFASLAYADHTDLDISIDRVKVNDQVVSESSSNLIDDSDTFLITVDFTAIIALQKGHVEAVLKGRQTKAVVSDSTMTFDIAKNQSATVALTLNLIDDLKREEEFDLTIKVIDARGNSEQNIYGLRTESITAKRILDVSIDSVEVESKSLAENENTFIVLKDAKNEIDLRVRLTSLEIVNDAHLEAILMFENGDVVADITANFDLAKDQSIVKKLELPLVDKFEQGNFMLKIKLVDAEGNIEEKSYGLKISQVEAPFIISSISLSPENNAQAGKFLRATLSFKNSGVVPLEGVTLKVSIPELGIIATKFVDDLDTNQPTIKEDFLLKIPETAQKGTYTIKSEISSQFGTKSEVKELSISIIGEGIKQIAEKLEVNIPVNSQPLFSNVEAIYPIILTNNGINAKSYTILVDGIDFGSYRILPSNTDVIGPGQTKTINLMLNAKDTEKGQKIFTVTVKSAQNILEEIPLKASIVPATAFNARKIFEWFVLLTVLLFTASAVFYAIKVYNERKKGGKKEEMQGYKEELPAAETYY